VKNLRSIAAFLALRRNPVLVLAQASPELRARTYGAYHLIRDCVVTTGSLIGAWLWSYSLQVNFAGAAVCGALARFGSGGLFAGSEPATIPPPGTHCVGQLLRST
jgi:hypothetical protein